MKYLTIIFITLFVCCSRDNKEADIQNHIVLSDSIEVSQNEYSLSFEPDDYYISGDTLIIYGELNGAGVILSTDSFIKKVEFKPVEYIAAKVQTEYKKIISPEMYYLFDDDEYYIFGGSMGEWGGSIFFFNKVNRQVYSFPVTAPVHVIKVDSGYLCLNRLDHLSGSTSVVLFKEPNSLFNLTDSTYVTANWWYDKSDSIHFEDYENRGIIRILLQALRLKLVSIIQRDNEFYYFGSHKPIGGKNMLAFTSQIADSLMLDSIAEINYSWLSGGITTKQGEYNLTKGRKVYYNEGEEPWFSCVVHKDNRIKIFRFTYTKKP